jgi:hypothetical protein
LDLQCLTHINPGAPKVGKSADEGAAIARNGWISAGATTAGHLGA